MAKIQIPRIFEVALVAATKAYQDLSPAIDYLNQLSDNVIRILTNGVSLGDNCDCQRITLDLNDQTPTSISVPRTPIAVYLAQQIPASPMITAFAWDIDNQGALRVTVKFDSVPTSKVNCSFYAHFS